MSQSEWLPLPPGRSGCPINMTMEVLGDRWSLVVLRDIIFSPRRHFRELLTESLEGIASNILADRLAKLVASGLLSRTPDPSHKQKVTYRLTEPAIQLVPVLAELGAWGARWLPTTPELRIRAELLAQGGPTTWQAFMDELRDEHVHGRPPSPSGVVHQLAAAHDRVAGSG
ncbi:MAG: helix-turn-helix domain-containing protein [Tetrasphaera sp.]